MAASFNVNYFPPVQMQPTTIKQNELRQSLCCEIRISSVSFGLSPQNQDEVARKPKLFFVSTSSTTTTKSLLCNVGRTHGHMHWKKKEINQH